MTPDGDGTKVSVVTDLTVSGKVAQFGRGVLGEVSAKLLGQFVDALEADLAKEGATEPDPPEAAAESSGPEAESPEPLIGNGAASCRRGPTDRGAGGGAG